MSAISVESPQVKQIDKAVDRLKEQLLETGDKETVHKLDAYLEKWQEQTLHIGFCGLFSAGKSTMINTLLGEALLPSNPIPTSANVVAIRYGEPRAVIYLTSGSLLTLDLDRLEEWKTFCTNGDEAERVDIFYPHPLLAKGVTLLDTPGVDSTDPRHQSATEAALHLADVVVFVTDYHYVQSEVNFSFVKRLKEQGKYLYLVVNQIDKHQDPGGDLGEYLSRLYSGIREWGLDVDGLLCTSLKQTDHPFNMLEQLQQVLDKVSEHKHYLLARHFKHGLELLLSQHREYLLEKQGDERESIQDQLDQLFATLGDDGAARYQAYLEAREAPQRARQHLEAAVQDILKNAIITPYVTTQLAREMIESYQEDFKVGWLFSAKKTEQERQRRVAAFYADLTQRVQAQIEWHLKDVIRKSLAEYRIDNQHLSTELLDWQLTVPQEWVTSLIRTGGVSRDYVYVYLDELKQKIHSLYRQQMTQVTDRLERYLDEDRTNRFETQQPELADCFQMLMAAGEQLLQLDAEVDAQMEQYKQTIAAITLPHLPAEQEAAVNLQLMVKPALGVSDGTGKGTGREREQQQGSRDKSASLKQTRVSQTPSPDKGSAAYRAAADQGAHDPGTALPIHHFDTLAAYYEQGAEILKQVPHLDNVAREWQVKGQRLKERRFRVCLFGAFSAGKSSFANALLGGPILPVSPHPTTAAINHIVPPTDKHPDGTYVVRMKSGQHIEREIEICLERLNLKRMDDMSHTLRQVHNIDPSSLRTSLRSYYAFLKACAKGWETVKDNLSKVFVVGHEQYTHYVADERLACFVQDITGHLDSPLTRLGLEIIDTPGADSIHTRHTDVTFNFLKQADVIIYLTYYNHAFSRADRHFLDQLGRVKEHFALDKMFFVVNAADLAASEEELSAVLQHVEHQLLQSGIRFPRLFPVSSLRAIEGRDEGFEQFKSAFFSFLHHELAEGVKAQVKADLQHGFQLLQDLKQETEQAKESKEEKKALLLALGNTWREKLEKAAYDSCLVELQKEIAEQLYYVNQRLFFNFKQYVDEAFHPGVLSDRTNIKAKLKQCLEELLFSLFSQLQDELKAAGLRIENLFSQLLNRECEQWVIRLKQEGLSVNQDPAVNDRPSQPPLEKNWSILDDKALAQALKHYKQPKQFFEQGGKEKLRETLESALKEMVSRYLDQVQVKWINYYEQEWHHAEQAMAAGLQEALQVVIEGRLAAIGGELSVEQLNHLIERYAQLLTQLNSD
ncbi:putative GTPase [Caldalkalibacillus uzonensis]|uniref:GTPase n=1 Tax=Caldalkalibacillus uzonensis TaxID=353224 RepID=A0ABU0CTJ6_9BACI|nr:dynamin family protein [Caldalkalibacillus uzonensis]MDQ0339746.1 putative GTPase [Caldalkalibacillus uzonensis]